MSRTHRLVVAGAAVGVQARKDTSRSATDEGDVSICTLLGASSIDDIDHIFVTSQNEDGEEAFRIDRRPHPMSRRPRDLPEPHCSLFWPKQQRRQPWRSNLSRDAMLFCAASRGSTKPK